MKQADPGFPHNFENLSRYYTYSFKLAKNITKSPSQPTTTKTDTDLPNPHFL